MSEFWKRTLSGAVYVGCVVGSIIWHPVAFGVLLLLIVCLAVNEFHKLACSGHLSRSVSIVAAAVMWAATEWFVLPLEQYGNRSWGVYALLGATYVLLIAAAMIDELWQKEEAPLTNWGNLLISQTMVALPLCSLALLGQLSKWLLLALFVLIWVNDSGAYCVGVLTAKRPQGNHKMFPRVSPKKSWEGLVGGIVFALLAALLLDYYGWFDAIASNERRSIIVLLFAFLVCTFGTLGDLMESILKRSIGVKDSGRFLPGHGGVLDRFDSILLAAPIVTIYSWICYALSSLL